ncbi:MAG: signal peptidase I [Ruminococcaceae bacterium]|nr:signal peptidase I [Oscillospiraceae bacterium]
MSNKFRVFEIENDLPDFSMMEDESLASFADEIEEDLTESGWLVNKMDTEPVEEKELSQEVEEPKVENEPATEEVEAFSDITSVEDSLFWDDSGTSDDKFEEKEINIFTEDEKNESEEIVEFSFDVKEIEETDATEKIYDAEIAEEPAVEEDLEQKDRSEEKNTEETVILSEEKETDETEIPAIIEGAADDDFYNHFGDLKLADNVALKENEFESFYLNYEDDERKPELKKNTEKKPKVFTVVLSWVLTIVVAFFIAIVVNIFIVRPSEVSGESMKPTLQHGETVILSRVPYFFSEPKREDIIVIDSRIPESNKDKRTVLTLFSEALQHNIITKLCGAKEPDYFWIKRVIGVPGDVIEFKDNCLYRNGILLEETYISEEAIVSYPNGVSIEVPAGYVYVMGDNRNHSSDSRVIGLVPRENIIGKMVGQM